MEQVLTHGYAKEFRVVERIRTNPTYLLAKELHQKYGEETESFFRGIIKRFGSQLVYEAESEMKQSKVVYSVPLLLHILKNKRNNKPMLLKTVRNQSSIKDGERLTFTNEGGYVDTKFGEKFSIGVKDDEGNEFSVLLNKPSQRAITRDYGSDTADWVDKVVTATLAKTVIDGEMKNVVYLTIPGKDLKGNMLIP